MLHQAEMDHKIEEEKRKLYREQQKKYNDDLEKQVKEYKEKTKKNLIECGSIIKSKEEIERELLRQKLLTKETHLLQMDEHQKNKLENRTRTLLEKQIYDDFVRKQKEDEERKKLSEKSRKNLIAANLRGSYDLQAQMKKREFLSEKQLDKKIIETQASSWPFVDYESKKVWIL